MLVSAWVMSPQHHPGAAELSRVISLTKKFGAITFNTRTPRAVLNDLGSPQHPNHFSLIAVMAITAISEPFSPLHLPQRMRWFFYVQDELYTAGAWMHRSGYVQDEQQK